MEWQREGIGYLQLNGVSGDGQVNVYYGESPDEARDKQHSILTDQVVFSGDQVTDLATMVIQPHTGSIYALKNSRAMRYALVECVGNISIDGVTLLSEMKDVKQRGSFECSDTLINRIW